MATVYGGTTNHWRAYMTYTAGSTNTDTTYAVNVSAAGMQSVGWGFSIGSGISCTVSATGQSSKSGSGGFSSGSGATVSKSFTSGTFSWTKGHSAVTKTITVKTTNSSGYCNGTSSKSITVTVPAKTSYTITFNANNGSGAPSSQTKWYGETLTLSTTKPTRSGYTFKGWATTSTATSAAYAAGGSYTANAAATLYAVWAQDYIAPTITSATAYRCNSSGTADEEGTYVTGVVKWKVDTTYTSGNTGKTLRVAFSSNDGSTYTVLGTISLSGTSGTTNYGPLTPSGGLDAGTSYKIKLSVTDNSGNSAATTSTVRTLSQSYFLMDVLAQSTGKALTFGRAATSADHGYVTVGGALDFMAESNMYLVDPYDPTLALWLGKPEYPSGTATTSTATATNTTILSLSIPPGRWLLNGYLGFPSNSTGRRAGYLGPDSSAGCNHAWAPANGAASTYDIWIHVELQTQTTYYLRAYQNSGSSLSVSGAILATRLH